MYYTAKILQAAGLAVLGLGFVTAFPHVVGMKTLWWSLVLFGCGWLIQRYGMSDKR